jgi:hypothetical protein
MILSPFLRVGIVGGGQILLIEVPLLLGDHSVVSVICLNQPGKVEDPSAFRINGKGSERKERVQRQNGITFGVTSEVSRFRGLLLG